MGDVKRWALIHDYAREAHMRLEVDGEYVQYDDHAALESAHAALQAEIDGLRARARLWDWVASGHVDLEPLEEGWLCTRWTGAIAWKVAVSGTGPTPEAAIEAAMGDGEDQG